MQPLPTRPIRIVQVSDTHMSETHSYFMDNYDVFVADMDALLPDLIVHTGDVTFNGPERPADFAFAVAEFRKLPCPVLAVAGNHDVGEAPRHARLDQPLTDERITAWIKTVGQLFWSRDVGHWRLIGLDTALLGSGRPEETEQHLFLENTLATRGPRPVMVIMHMPPYFIDPKDERPTTSAVPHEARGALLETFQRGGVKVIACGHLHIYRRMRYKGMQIVWAPPTAMVNVERQWRQWHRWARPGYIIWTLDGARISHELVEPRLMIAQDTSRWTDAGGTTTTLPPRPLKRARNEWGIGAPLTLPQ